VPVSTASANASTSSGAAAIARSSRSRPTSIASPRRWITPSVTSVSAAPGGNGTVSVPNSPFVCTPSAMPSCAPMRAVCPSGLRTTIGT
jgi:hypothetical protein